jgi:hypothetical protein
LIVISSPYARRGILWDAYRDYYRADAPSRILVAQASSLRMNSTLPKEEIDAEYEKDAAYASSEYGALFRTDIESFIRREAVEACAIRERYELPPQPVRYTAFVDPSGGSHDSMCLAIAHKQDDTIVVDLVREIKAPLNPVAVSREFSDIVKRYGLYTVYGDRYAMEYCADAFRQNGVDYTVCELNRSEIYLNVLPKINSGQVELLNIPVLINQLCNLERHVAKSGKDTIGKAPGCFDDLINAAAGAIVYCDLDRVPILISSGVVNDTSTRDPNYFPADYLFATAAIDKRKMLGVV